MEKSYWSHLVTTSPTWWTGSGGGDSFMGGLIYDLLTYPDDQQALNFAVAASCLKHSIYGDANLVTVGEVQQLMKGCQQGEYPR